MYFSSLQKWDVQTSDRFVRESICCQIFAKRIYARDNPSLEAASSSLLLHIYIYIHIAEPNLIEYISLSSWQCYERWLPIIFTSKSIWYFRLFLYSIVYDCLPQVLKQIITRYIKFFLSNCIATLQIRMRLDQHKIAGSRFVWCQLDSSLFS